MPGVEEFIYNFEGEKRKLLLLFHNWFTKELNLLDKIHYKVPFYYRKSWICYLNPKKNEKIELVFIRGNELSNEQGILDFKDRKQVAGIEIGSISEINRELLNEIIQEAILLDDITPYKSKRKKLI